MPIEAPNLDDRTYDDIVADAKALIPRYTPEWTDLNDSDPGITLVQLFAWMTDTLLYRLNCVPERNYVKFLQLLGIEAEPAHPASAELTFTLARPDIEMTIVPRGTQVAAPGRDGGPPAVFETDEALIALGAQLQAVQSYDGFVYSDVTVANGAAGQWFLPFGPLARPGSALLLGFATPVPFTREQLNLTFVVETGGLQPEGAHRDLDVGLVPPSASLAWEYWDGQGWGPLGLDKDTTRAFERSGHMYFTGPGPQVVEAAVGVVAEPLHWLRCHLTGGSYENAPRIEQVMTNTVAATQAVTVHDEILGGSDGMPAQRFRLANAPVLEGLRLEVEEQLGTWREWQPVDDFLHSSAADRHYVLDRGVGEVRFGDGRRGAIPPALEQNRGANVVAREYRWGGGASGNVGATTITGLQGYVEAVDSVTNPRPAVGGTDEEPLEDAKLRAPAQLKSKGRAVTADDFEYLARQTPGARVRRARALPLYHPRFREARIPGVVTVVVVPDGKAPNPVPSDATLRLVCAHLNVHRLLTAEVHVVPPDYRRVRIEGRVVVAPDADLAEVKGAIDNRLATYFHPLAGGEDGSGWPFGGTIYYSQVLRQILEIAGVLRADSASFAIWLDEQQGDPCADMPLPAGALTWSDGHGVAVSYGGGA